MYKYFLPILTLLFCVEVSSAQITLSPANNYQVGDILSANNIFMTGLNFDPGEEGMDVVWDFSQLSAGDLVESEILSISALPNSALFPDATVGFSEQSSHSYFSGSPTAKSFHGAITAGGLELVYSDPQDILRYPLTFASNYIDEFDGFATTNITVVRRGTAEVMGDAYGTLITPNGTYEDVLRVKTIMEYGDFINDIEVAHYSEERYWWYNTVEQTPIFSITFSDFVFQQITTIAYLEGSTTSIRNTIAPDALKLYPNPASNQVYLNINETNADNLQLKVFNQMGQIVHQQHDLNANVSGNKILINIQDLPNGAYFVSVYDGEVLIGREQLVVIH